MAERTLTFVISNGGCGTHLLMDFFRTTELAFLETQMVEFWPTLVQARRAPDQPCVADYFRGVSALEAVKGFYAMWGVDGGEQPLEISTAKAAFAAFLADLGPHLATAHNYQFINRAEPAQFAGRTGAWTREMRDEARGLFEAAVTEAGYHLRPLFLVRHPVDLFLSAVERTSDVSTEAEILDNMDALFEVMVSYGKEGRPHEVIRFEDICRGDPAALAVLRDHGRLAGPIPSDRFGGGEHHKYLRYPRARILRLLSLLGEHVHRLGYTVKLPPPGLGWLTKLGQHLGHWRSEKVALDRIFAGDFSAPNAVFRHRRSILCRLYWQSILLFSPVARSNYRHAYRLIHGTEMPTPRMERLLGRSPSHHPPGNSP